MRVLPCGRMSRHLGKVPAWGQPLPPLLLLLLPSPFLILLLQDSEEAAADGGGGGIKTACGCPPSEPALRQSPCCSRPSFTDQIPASSPSIIKILWLLCSLLRREQLSLSLGPGLPGTWLLVGRQLLPRPSHVFQEQSLSGRGQGGLYPRAPHCQGSGSGLVGPRGGARYWPSCGGSKSQFKNR